MKKLLLLILSFTHFISHSSQDSRHSQANDNVIESFFYGGVGAYNAILLPLPSFGLGYRFQYNHVGLDLSVDGTSLLICNFLRLSPAILFYPKPDNASQMYTGFACGCLYINHADVYRGGWNNNFFCLPELVVGYQYKRNSGKNNFIELRLGAPIIHLNPKKDPYYRYTGGNEYTYLTPIIIPCASIKFGFGF